MTVNRIVLPELQSQQTEAGTGRYTLSRAARNLADGDT
jgi:hypothetical protein